MTHNMSSFGNLLSPQRSTVYMIFILSSNPQTYYEIVDIYIYIYIQVRVYAIYLINTVYTIYIFITHSYQCQSPL